MSYSIPDGSEGPKQPGLSTRMITDGKYAGWIRDQWMEWRRKLTDDQLENAFEMKYTLYPVVVKNGNAQPSQSPRQKARKLIRAFDTTNSGVLPTKQSFEVIERALAGLPQRGPEGVPTSPPVDHPIVDQVVEMLATDMPIETRAKYVVLAIRDAFPHL